MNKFARTIRFPEPSLRSLQIVALVTSVMLISAAAFAEGAREKLAARGLDFTTEEFIYHASLGELEVVKIYLAAGMDVNAANPYATKRRRGMGGRTALHMAASGGHAKLVGYLLKNGAAPDPRGSHNQSPLLAAAAYGHMKIVEMLANKGADVNSKDTYSQTPLIYSVKAGKIDAVKILLAYGAKTNEIDMNGGAALDYANDPRIAGLLKGAGGKKANELR